jgi:hypothetical protein
MLPEKARGVSNLKRKDGARMFERIFCLHFVPLGTMGRVITQIQGISEIVVGEMWQKGVRFQAKRWEECGEVVLKGHSLILRCMTFHSWGVRCTKATEECTVVLSMVFPFSEKLPFSVLITCPHCLLHQKENPRRIDMEECERMILQSQKTYCCDGDTLNVEVLGNDIFFGFVKCLDGGGRESVHGTIFWECVQSHIGQKMVVVKELRAEGLVLGF